MAALAWRNQNRQPDRSSTDGRMGRHCGWESDRAYDQQMEKIRQERSETDLGMRGRRGLARGACESESAGDCAAHARGISGITRGPCRRTPKDDGIRPGAMDRAAINAFRTLLPSEQARQARAAHSLPSSDPRPKTGIIS